VRRTQTALSYADVRAHTEALAAPLSAEDQTVQSMPDVSPTKWHRAHTTWFFETFVLSSQPGYEAFDERFAFLFNSYYEGVGPRHERSERGLLTRPGVAEVAAYREHVDAAMAAVDHESDLVQLGLHHEQQHQELLVTDLKHNLYCNPLHPAYHKNQGEVSTGDPGELTWVRCGGGLHEIGWGGEGFSFDNEAPRHRVWIEPFSLAARLVTNGEYLDFVRDGGYANPLHWLSEGWATLQARGWKAPLYWMDEEGEQRCFKLSGLQPLDLREPVSHVSFFEADAFTRWAGLRLPTEAEWEIAAADQALQGNFLAPDRLHPRPAQAAGRAGSPQQLYGDLWEWTGSQYLPYPGFKQAPGAVGEYNGKFMCNQWVLRGGSCATPEGHIRPTYRNFFPPDARWQFSGIRPAADAE